MKSGPNGMVRKHRNIYDVTVNREHQPVRLRSFKTVVPAVLPNTIARCSYRLIRS